MVTPTLEYNLDIFKKISLGKGIRAGPLLSDALIERHPDIIYFLPTEQ